MPSALPDLLRRSALSLSLLLAAFPAAAQTRTDATVLMSDRPGGRKFQDQYGFSDAVIAGDLIFLSGIVAGAPPGSTDLALAFDSAYQHIGRILRRAGADYGDIVDLTTFHTDITAQIDAFAAVHKKYVKMPYPTWTAIDVDRLLPDEGLVEIKIVARKPADGTP